MSRWAMLCFLALAAGATQGLDAAAERAVRAVATGIIAADNDRSVERVMAFYAPEATLWPPDESPVRGLDRIRPRYEALFASSQPKLTTTIDAVSVDSKVAIVEGRVNGQFEPRGAGAVRSVADCYLMVLGRGADGVWRITHLAWRSVAPR